MMFLVELLVSSFLDLISKQARPKCRCKRVLVLPGCVLRGTPVVHCQGSSLYDWFQRKLSGSCLFCPHGEVHFIMDTNCSFHVAGWLY